MFATSVNIPHTLAVPIGEILTTVNIILHIDDVIYVNEKMMQRVIVSLDA